MIYHKSEVLTRNGWSSIGDLEVAHFDITDSTIYWSPILLDYQEVQEVHLLKASEWASVAVTGEHKIATVDYYKSYSENTINVNIPYGLDKNDCLVNRFKTFLDRDTPMTAFNHTCRKRFDTEQEHLIEQLTSELDSHEIPYEVHNSTIIIDSDTPFRLVEELVDCNRYKEFAHWHGRSDLRKMSGLHIELNDRTMYSNYYSKAIDNIQLSALGSNRSTLLKNGQLLVYNKAPPLKVTKKEILKSMCYSLKGEGFILTRTNGCVGVVSVS